VTFNLINLVKQQQQQQQKQQQNDNVKRANIKVLQYISGKKVIRRKHLKHLSIVASNTKVPYQ
jgi:hypothetical protein